MFNTSTGHASAHSLVCLGLDERTEASLKSLLGLLKGKTPSAWKIVENIDANVIIYNPGSPLAQALLRREERQATGHVFVPCSDHDPGKEGLSLPLRAERLLNCLQAASSRLGKQAIPAADDNLCERLDLLLQNKSVIAVEIVAGTNTGVINPTRKTISWEQSLDADAVAQMVLSDVSLRPLQISDLNVLRNLEHKMKQHQSWDAALWAIGVGTSRGQLLPRLRANQPYRLTRFPDFCLIGRRSSDVKATALLTHKSMTPNELVAETGFSDARVFGFINACALSGLLEVVQPAEQVVSAQAKVEGDAPPASGMFQRIRRALEIGAH